MSTSNFYALRADDQELVFAAMKVFATTLSSAGFGKLTEEGLEEVKHGERFHWALDAGGGKIEFVVHDDQTMPAMVLEVTGPAKQVADVTPHVEKTFDIAPAHEVIETAKIEQADDPAMLVLSAWVATERDEAALMKLLKEASDDDDVEVRRGAAMAAGVQATPALRKLVEAMAAKEGDAKLAKQMKRMLDIWRPTR